MFQGHPVPSTRHYAARPAGRAITPLAPVVTFDACLALLLALFAGSSDQGAGRFVAEPLMDTPAIHDAAVFGPLSRVERMLEQDPTSVGATDRFGFTALHGVVAEHHFDIARLLIAKGADVNAGNDEGVTPLHLAAYPEMVEILVANGARLDARDSNGNTPLHAVTEHPELIDVMEKLLKLGADPNARNHDGASALDLASERQEQDKVDLLMRHGAHRPEPP